MCGRCDGFILGKADGKCYRRSGIHVAACRASSSYDLYMRVWPEPLPPLPPAAPAPLQPPLPPVIPPAPPLRPSPLSPPTLPKLEAINLRFTSGRPSNSLAAAGVLLHQFDGLEDWGNGRGYRPCHSGWCNGRYDHVSTSLINKHLPRIFNSAGDGLRLWEVLRWAPTSPPSRFLIARRPLPVASSRLHLLAASIGCTSTASLTGPRASPPLVRRCHPCAVDAMGVLLPARRRHPEQQHPRRVQPAHGLRALPA